MRLTFLGTSAGENYPALWCNCPNCEYARRHGGKNIRQNTCTMLDDDVMLDLSNHAFQSSLLYGRDLTALRLLLVTHRHKDHLYTHHLIWRTKMRTADNRIIEPANDIDMDEAVHWMGSRLTPLPWLDIYGHESVYQEILQNDRYHPELEDEVYKVAFHPLRSGETVFRPDLDISFTAVASRHGVPTFNYIIERGGTTLLYALDCGSYEADMLSLIAKYRYDCVVIEGTFGLMPDRFEMHQNLDKNLEIMRFFDENRLWKTEKRFIITHMSPHWTPPHEEYCRIVAPYGMTVAYDGMSVEF